MMKQKQYKRIQQPQPRCVFYDKKQLKNIKKTITLSLLLTSYAKSPNFEQKKKCKIINYSYSKYGDFK